MAPRPFLSRIRLRLRRCWRSVSGWQVYLLALVIALPDILDGLAGLDLSPLLPVWLSSTKLAAALAIGRLFARAYAT